MARTWGVAIVVGLPLAAALIVLPRPLLFAPKARGACQAIGANYAGLASESGRYADPVPEGASCTGAPSEPVGTVTEVEVDFFTEDEALNGILGWLYRLACLLIPIDTALAIGSRLSQRSDAPAA